MATPSIIRQSKDYCKKKGFPKRIFAGMRLLFTPPIQALVNNAEIYFFILCKKCPDREPLWMTSLLWASFAYAYRCYTQVWTLSAHSASEHYLSGAEFRGYQPSFCPYDGWLQFAFFRLFCYTPNRKRGLHYGTENTGPDGRLTGF